MDKLNEVGKSLRKTSDNVNASLHRPLVNDGEIERSRDIFDSVFPFEMFFKSEDFSKGATLSLYFSPLPISLASCCAGCYCSVCEVFTNLSSNIITTAYSYEPGSIRVYQNDAEYSDTFSQGSHNWIETTSTTITLTSSYIGYTFKVCYVYKIDGCT